MKRYRVVITPQTSHHNYDGLMGEAVITFYTVDLDLAEKVADQYADLLGGMVDSVSEMA